MPLLATSDPDVLIEEQRVGYVRYRRSDGRRWEVHGTCDRRGDCLVGAVVETPAWTIEIADHEHLATICESVGQDRIDSLLDVPVTPEFRGCCPFTFVELDAGS